LYRVHKREIFFLPRDFESSKNDESLLGCPKIGTDGIFCPKKEDKL